MHPESLYRHAISQSLRLVLHNKKLWLIGIIAGIVHSGGIFESVLRGGQELQGGTLNPSALADIAIPGAGSIVVMLRAIQANMLPWWGALLMALVFIALIAGVLAAAGWAQGALLGAVVRLEAGPQTKALPKLTLKEIHTEAKRAMWRNIGINLFLKLKLVAVVAISLLPILFTKNALPTAQFIASFVSFAVFLPLALLIVTTQSLALAESTLKQTPFMKSIKNAWALVRKEWLVMLETSALLFLMSLGALAAFLLFVYLLQTPVNFFLYTATALQSESLLLTLWWLYNAVLFGVLAVLFGILVATQYATWATIYVRFHKGIIVKSAVSRYLGGLAQLVGKK